MLVNQEHKRPKKSGTSASSSGAHSPQMPGVGSRAVLGHPQPGDYASDIP